MTKLMFNSVTHPARKLPLHSNLLRERREAAGYSMVTLSAVSGVAVTTIHRAEAGCFIRDDTKDQLARALDLPVKEVFPPRM